MRFDHSKAKYLFIDGNHLSFRSYFLLGEKANIGKGRQVSNAVCYGFINTILNLMGKLGTKKPIICFDSPPYFRHQIYPDYKGNRKQKDDQYISAVLLAKQMLKDIGFCVLEFNGLEADDLCGIFSKSLLDRYGIRSVICTDDKDYLQLLRKGIVIYRPGKNEIYTRKRFKEEYQGLAPEKLILIKAIAGDAGDNIIGVSGVGEKTAIDLIKTHGDWKGIFSAKKKLLKDKRCSKIFERETLDRIRMNLTLVKIPTSPNSMYLDESKFNSMLKTVKKKVRIRKSKLSKILARYGLNKFRNLILKDEKDYEKLLGLTYVKNKTVRKHK